MKTHNLGTLDGEVLVFGGPYSNLQALAALLDIARARSIPVANIVGTGDVAAYFADAEACVARMRNEGIRVVAGNCEHQLATGSDNCDCGFEEDSFCSALSRGWYAHAQRTLSADSLAWMAGCPDRIVFDHDGVRYGVVHGAASSINRFIWPNTEGAVLRSEMDLFARESGAIDTLLCGHSGLSFSKTLGGKTWLNAGTIGLPENNGDPRTRFVLLSGGKAQILPLPYNHRESHAAMLRAGLVQGYHEALTSGYWPSEDTLPKELRRAA